MAYRFKRNTHSKLQETKPHNDLSKHRSTDFFQSEHLSTDYGTRTYKALLSFDFRSKVKRRNAYNKDRARITASGFKLQVGTMEQDLYIKGPSQGVWNKTESL